MSEPGTFREVVDAHAKARPGAPFLCAPEVERTVDYAALAKCCRALTAAVAARGVAPGATVSFMLENGVSAATIFLGAMYGGYVVSPINLHAQDAQLAYTLTHSQTRIVYTTQVHEARLAALRARANAAFDICIVGLDGLDLPASMEGEGEGETTRPDDPAMLMYTSGTTGMPKGVLLSHANMLAGARAVAASLALGPHDRVLSSLPLYHINGQCIATVAPLVSGGSIVMPHRFSASQWWPLVERYRPTWLNMVPTIIAYLLNGPGLTPQQAAAAHGIRFGRSASAPLPPEQHRAFEARFGFSVIEAMGLTECSSVAFTNPLERGQRKYGSPGRPVGVEA
ncbi:MAG TPA: AMP-binding protein, partial [Casimicrobiaceae bacterium]